MGKFSDYLKFTDDFFYKDKQIKKIASVNLNDEQIEKLEKIDKDVKLLVFAHPECPDCLQTIGILEKMALHIPSIKIDYRKRKDDKELLLQYNPEGKIPTILLMEDIKVTLIFSEFPNSMKMKTNENPLLHDSLRKDFHNGKFDNEIIEDLIKRIGE